MNKLFIFLLLSTSIYAQDAKEIIRQADQKLRGTHSFAEMSMTIVRPGWQREMTMKSWALGDEYALILVTAPARDEGTAFLKRGNEIWNWQPKINRSIKLPPSMMMQSWMGSDFTNDDLVKQSSVVTDYDHKMLGEEIIENRSCYKIELTPLPQADVVWGKVISWIDKKDLLQLRTEFYDEDGFLINTMEGSSIKTLGGKLLPTKMTITPEEDPGSKTIIEYHSMDFAPDVSEAFFSIQNMKRVR